jgi:hypothetical protein
MVGGPHLGQEAWAAISQPPVLVRHFRSVKYRLASPASLESSLKIYEQTNEQCGAI